MKKLRVGTILIALGNLLYYIQPIYFSVEMKQVILVILVVDYYQDYQLVATSQV